ncbi:MAG: aminoacyl-tRNA hydrolase [Pseudomonadales bacterium]|nr:aminoacyl-tRNA hydrolase [Pseudomonadales bacterium]
MSRPLKLIVGLGNPGAQYAQTRHNAGAWLVERFADQQGGAFKEEKKFFSRTAVVNAFGHEVRLAIPTTYMNESGRAVGAIVRFFRIDPEEILIAHDELDLPIGVVRMKMGGGLAGHNGLRDISAALAGNQAFNRIRVGVGHPGDKSQVTGHVLGKASAQDRDAIDTCIDEALKYMELAIDGRIEQAMNSLNGFKVDVGQAPGK